MVIPDKSIAEKLQIAYPVGTRVKLVCMDDPQAPPAGTCGTVAYIDDTATIHVNWDNGSSLGVIYDKDTITKL